MYDDSFHRNKMNNKQENKMNNYTIEPHHRANLEKLATWLSDNRDTINLEMTRFAKSEDMTRLHGETYNESHIETGVQQ